MISRNLASIWSRVIRSVAVAHGVSFSGRVRPWPRLIAHTATAATITTATVQMTYGDPGPVAGEGGARFALEQAEKAHGQDDQADRQRHRAGHAEQHVAAEPLERVEGLLLDVVDDQLEGLATAGPQSAQSLPRTAPLPLPLRPRATVLLGRRRASTGADPATGSIRSTTNYRQGGRRDALRRRRQSRSVNR